MTENAEPLSSKLANKQAKEGATFAVFMCAYLSVKRNGLANSVITLKYKCVVCLSLELQQIECALTHDVNDLYVTTDHGYIVIVYGVISSYRTPPLHKL